MLDIDQVRAQLPGRRVDWHATVGSTMDEAALLAAEDCTYGTAVVAEEQTAGQGRHGRRWHSEPGAGLYVSVVVRVKLPPDSLPVLMLALGLAAAEAIARTTALRPDLRWPNDIMLDDRKAAGILVELSDGVPIAGFGINVNHAAFPAEIAGHATSLRIASGRVESRERLLVELLTAIDRYTRALQAQGRVAIIEQFTRASSYARGKRVRVEQPDGAIVGTTAGLDAFGFLKVRADDGSESLILAGGVRSA